MLRTKRLGIVVSNLIVEIVDNLHDESEMKLDSRQISEIGNYFKDKSVLKAYLFGSCARDKADDQSDIDILVERDYAQPIGLEFVQMQLDLQDLLNRQVDLLSQKAIPKHIQSYIEPDSVLVYARRSG